MVTATQVIVLIDHDDRRTVPVPDSFRAARREFEERRALSGPRRSRRSTRSSRASGEADDILRAVVSALVEPGGCGWAGILFVEGGELVLGPEAGIAEPGEPERRCRSSSRALASPSSPPTGATTRALLERVASSSRRTASSAGTRAASPGTRGTPPTSSLRDYAVALDRHLRPHGRRRYRASRLDVPLRLRRARLRRSRRRADGAPHPPRTVHDVLLGPGLRRSQEALLTAPIFAVFGSSWLALRLVPIALSAVTAILIWRVGLRLMGERPAAVAAAIFWIWPPFLIYKLTHQWGFYASGVLYCVLLILLGLRVVEQPSTLRAAVFGLVLGLAGWETEQIVPIALPLMAWMVWKKPRLAPQALDRRACGAGRRCPVDRLERPPRLGLVPIDRSGHLELLAPAASCSSRRSCR